MHFIFHQLMIFVTLALAVQTPIAAAETDSAVTTVSLLRTPHGGIQPQAAVDAAGTLHLIYFKGEPAAGDIYYVRREAGEDKFSPPIRVNSHPHSAVAMGTIRGAQLAIGKAGHVHVVWNGSKRAQPRSSDPEHDTPMLYTRLNDALDAFEPQRNLIQDAHGLDGGGSVAADQQGNVYVVWHANPAADGEANRRVYLAVSRDAGESFASEVPISQPGTGACGCCGLNAFADSDARLLVMYRSATDFVHRDMYLLSSDDEGHSFDSQIVDPWQIARCPMSSAALAEGPTGVIAGWETTNRVHFGWDRGAGSILERVSPGGEHAAHPAAAVNDDGEAIFVWTEGTGWNRGGAVAWQVYDAEGEPTAVNDRRVGVPTWSLATVVANPQGGFTIIY